MWKSLPRMVCFCLFSYIAVTLLLFIFVELTANPVVLKKTQLHKKSSKVMESSFSPPKAKEIRYKNVTQSPHHYLGDNQEKVKSTGANFTDWASVWEGVITDMSARHLYSTQADVTGVLWALRDAPILDARLFAPEEEMERDEEEKEGEEGEEIDRGEPVDFGSTHKWLLTLAGGQKALFKPDWYGRHVARSLWADGFESPHAEIASFHLDRALGFRRVPFTTGRHVVLTSEILPVASEALMRHLIHTDAGLWCLQARCPLCTAPRSVCPPAGRLFGSLTLLVPGVTGPSPSPWGVRRLYRHAPIAAANHTHCDVTRRDLSILQDDETLLQLVDLAILDHLSVHFDSKLYQTADGLLTYIDRGRAFSGVTGRDRANLFPLTHCCRIHKSTYHALTESGSDRNIWHRFVASVSKISRPSTNYTMIPVTSVPIRTIPDRSIGDRIHILGSTDPWREVVRLGATALRQIAGIRDQLGVCERAGVLWVW